MKIDELLTPGIYGVKDLKIDKIVYVGSSNTTIFERLGQHFSDTRRGTHCNKKLSALFKSGKFEIIVLEGNIRDKKKILEREAHYTRLYKADTEGYNINTGGCKIIKRNKRTIPKYPLNQNVEMVRNFISKYCNTRLYKETQAKIIEYCNSLGFEKVASTNFSWSLSRFGFNVDTLSNRRDYIIKPLNAA